jgi:hypothetical protein
VKRSGPLADRVDAWPANGWQLTIVPGKQSTDWCIDQIDPAAALDWDALDRYKELAQLSYDGTDATLITWLAKRRHVKTLFWESHQLGGVVDFRRTHLETLAIQPGNFTLQLPRALKELRLLQLTGAEKLHVEAARQGAGLELAIVMGSARPPRIPPGLSAITRLDVSFARTVKIKQLLACPKLEELDLHGDPAFSLPDPQHLAKLTKLRRLTLTGAYDLAAARFPAAAAFAHIERIEIDGIAKPEAAILRERLLGIDLELARVKSLEWIRDNLSNPFRDWGDDHGARFAATATKAWKQALAAIAKLGDDPTAAAAKRALKPFVDVFNRLDAGAGVDTIMREQLFDVFVELVPEAHGDAAEDWFDDMRDF